MTKVKIMFRGNLLLLGLVLTLTVTGQQIPKGANAINIVGVGFNQMANSLLDAGFILEKTDSILQTIQTEFKQSSGNSALELSLFVRIKDSTAKLTGKVVNNNLIGMNLMGNRISKESATFTVENTSGNFKKVFYQMSDFAKSFNKPVEYLKQ